MTEREQKIHDVMREGAKYGETLLKNALTRAGLVLTGDLVSSVKIASSGLADRYEPEIVYEFSDYMRYRDKTVNVYTGYTNTDAIIKFVEKVGIQNFAFVSGRQGDPSQIANAASKIAWAILNDRRQVLTLKNKANKRVYNKTKMLLFNKIARDIRQANLESGLVDLVKSFG